jgi:CheY-like chemotaxis protein
LQNTILAQRIVWVIDNDANICAGMARLLSGWDCTVITAISLEHLEEQVNIYQDYADILIVDYHLDDDKTGYSAAKAINKERKSLIPTLMITANYSKSLKKELENTGILLLNKPIKPMKLKTSMLHLLR